MTSVAAAKTLPPVAVGGPPLSLFYMLLSIDNTHLCFAAVSPRFLLYVHAHYVSLCHPTGTYYEWYVAFVVHLKECRDEFASMAWIV
jgi:hypothetical protein